MRHALIGGTLVAIASGLIGYFVVIRRDAFAAHALAHIGFPGRHRRGADRRAGHARASPCSASPAGSPSARWASGSTAARSPPAPSWRSPPSLGVLFSSMASQSANTITNVLFGNLLAISPGRARDVRGADGRRGRWRWARWRDRCCSRRSTRRWPRPRACPVRALGVVFMVLLAIVITMAVQVVGTLLLFALVVTPAATAIAITARPAAVVVDRHRRSGWWRCGSASCCRRCSTCRRASRS